MAMVYCLMTSLLTRRSLSSASSSTILRLLFFAIIRISMLSSILGLFLPVRVYGSPTVVGFVGSIYVKI